MIDFRFRDVDEFSNFVNNKDKNVLNLHIFERDTSGLHTLEQGNML